MTCCSEKATRGWDVQQTTGMGITFASSIGARIQAAKITQMKQLTYRVDVFIDSIEQ